MMMTGKKLIWAAAAAASSRKMTLLTVELLDIPSLVSEEDYETTRDYLYNIDTERGKLTIVINGSFSATDEDDSATLTIPFKQIWGANLSFSWTRVRSTRDGVSDSMNSNTVLDMIFEKEGGHITQLRLVAKDKWRAGQLKLLNEELEHWVL